MGRRVRAATAPGTPGHRTLPPALIADIAGGAYPAVMNILLALRRRDENGEGAFLDVAMTENVFPFMFGALANANAAGAWPRSSSERLTGGSPRYHIYESKDGALITVAALEQKFWLAFTKAIGLEAELIDDRRDPARTIARVTEIIASRNAADWKPIFDQADCCCSIAQDLRAAVADPQFAAGGIFARMLANDGGDTIPALPLPLANSLQNATSEPVSAVQPGAHNAEFGF